MKPKNLKNPILSGYQEKVQIFLFDTFFLFTKSKIHVKIIRTTTEACSKLKIRLWYNQVSIFISKYSNTEAATGGVL